MAIPARTRPTGAHLAFLTLLSHLLVTVLAAPAPSPIPAVVPTSTKKRASFSDVFSGQFGVQRSSVTWLDSTNSTEDGTYVVDQGGLLIFKNIITGANSTFANKADFGVDNVWDYWIQPDEEKDRNLILFSANWTKSYRYSGKANYYIFDRSSKTTLPLAEDQKGDIQYAGWSPKGDVIAYVRGNNLFVWKDGKTTQITVDGGPDVFNAVPDWVYEEEIYGDVKTLWFSPDGEYIAFLKMDETGVPTFEVQYFMAGQKVAPPYPSTLPLRYPKVGQKNPTVSFHLVPLSTLREEKVEFSTFDEDDLIITEVAWVAEEHESVIFRTRNRVQDLEKLVLVDVESRETKVVRERDATDGWLEPNHDIVYIPGLDKPAYLDTSDHTGWNHIYLYSVDGSEEPIALTKGEWEVTSILKVDTARNKVYYLSTERHSTERHLYSVGLDGKGKKALVDDKKEGVYSASFSGGAGYYILSYNGPQLPWQKLYTVDSSASLQTLNDNASLKAKLEAYELPTQTWSELKHPDGFTLNVVEYKPAGFNPRKKYPVLFAPYGGPGAQETTKTFRHTVDFRNYLASDKELEFVIVIVDNRGTGYKGRKFKSTVTRQLGKLEAEDQVFAAKQWAKKSYVDEKKIAIWGWSYGGYLSAKVLELDSGVFSLGVITAPVSDWRFYDSMYTERYMKRLEDNLEGYKTTAVAKAQGFKNVAGGFLVQHGTGDDNVHYQHAAVMIDTLQQAKVNPDKMHMHAFTDSDHSIAFNGARDWVYRQLTETLYNEKIRSTKPEKKHSWDA